MAPGGLLHVGSSTIQVRQHPGLHRPRLARPAKANDSITSRLFLPLIMSAGMVPLILGGGGSPWRLVFVIALPVGIALSVVLPALRKRGTEPTPTVELPPPPGPDPAELLLAGPASLPNTERWDVGTAVPDHARGRNARHTWSRRSQRRREKARYLNVVAPGQMIALVGPPQAVDALGRWLACQSVASGAEVRMPPSWSLDSTASSPGPAASANASGGTNTLSSAPSNRQQRVHILHSSESAPALEPDIGYVVLGDNLAHVPSGCAQVYEVPRHHNRLVSDTWAGVYLGLRARSLDQSGSVPNRVSLDDFMGTGVEAIRRAWGAHIGDDLAAPIGACATGTLTLDLVAQGPHAVVAGTTGSGKSELLLAWVLGMASRYPPGDLTFLLIDYKGGATFAPIADLPQVCGVLTDLDGTSTARALTSLKAELHRRERLLASVQAANLSAYRAQAKDRGSEPIPRLVVIVDEFRAMADDHPEQLAALVRLAAQGRSLGIHLVLATQRPAGAINADMRANLTVRICLRVLSDADSQDTLGIRDGATLPAIPGRAIIATESNTTFQAAWAGNSAHVAARVRWLIDASTQLIAAEPWRGELPAPWAPALPDSITLGDLADSTIAEDAHPRRLTWLRSDLPDHQRLGTTGINLPGSLLISGPPRSGRSTAAAALAHAACALSTGSTAWPSDAEPSTPTVHLLADPHLAPTGAPALGTVVSLHDPRRARRLLHLLATGTATSAGAILIVDDVEAWCEALDETGGVGTGTDLLETLLRRSRRLGLSLVLTASAAHRWANHTEQHLVLAPREVMDAVAHGAPKDIVGTGWPPGRGILLERGTATVCQAAIPSAESTQWPERSTVPLRIAELPETVDNPRSAPAAPHLTLGVGGDDASTVSAELPAGGTWLIAAAQSDTRDAVLAMLRRQLHDQGRTDVVVASGAERADAVPEPVPSGAAMIAAACPDRLTHAYHDLAARAREAETCIVIDHAPPGLLKADIRPFLDPSPPPGRAILVDRNRVVVVQLAIGNS